MVEESPQINPVDPSPEPELTSPWHSNGATSEPSFKPVGAAADTAIAEAETDSPEPATVDDGAVFMASLAKVMKDAATAERGRVDEDIERRRVGQIEAINARRESETAGIRELAEQDGKAIDAWVESEHQRIADEQGRRVAALQADLETSLAQHGTQMDLEIERVEAAIAAHRSEVDAYFSKLDENDDPVAIAQNAGHRPAFPDLDAIAAPAAAAAPVIGVMDVSEALEPAGTWGAWNASTVTTGEAVADPASADAASADEAFPTVALAPPSATDVTAEGGTIGIGAEAVPAGAGSTGSIDAIATPISEPVAVVAGSWKPPEPTPTPTSSSSGGAMGWFRRDHGGH